MILRVIHSNLFITCQIIFAFGSTLFIRCLTYVYKIYRSRRSHAFILFSFILIIWLFYSLYENQTKNKEVQYSPMYTFDTNTFIYLPIYKVQNETYRLVLLWTDLFSNFYWYQESFFNSNTIISCSSIHRCQFTRDKHKLSQASIVAFHLYDIERYELPKRTVSKNHSQAWIFITGESPINFYYQNPSFLPYVLDNYFDQAISYKYDSPFRIFSATNKHRMLSGDKSNSSFSYINETLHERQLNYHSLKYKKMPIAWIVSNCITFSQREEYVGELRKFIQIDIYGQCGRSCSNNNKRECQLDLHQYYFYLAFENSRCNSYITEKFWRIISDSNHRLVPIVMGPKESDYAQVAPKQSYIHVDNYRTPEDLAKYLKYLIHYPEEYLTYLRWREYTRIELVNTTRWRNLLCPLCKMAYETPLFSSNPRLNFSLWYNPTTECHQDDVKLYKQCKQTNLRIWMSWIYHGRCP